MAKADKIREAAQACAAVEFGDFGTLGGNQAPGITDFVLSLKGAERILFTDLYLAELRVRLLSPNFVANTSFQEETNQFNPRTWRA